MKTVGFKLTKLEPVNGFAAETAGGAAITLGSFFGIPLSTTHTINTAIMGVGATRRMSAVHWDVARRIVAAWGYHIPRLLRSGLDFIENHHPLNVDHKRRFLLSPVILPIYAIEGNSMNSLMRRRLTITTVYSRIIANEG